MTDQNDHYRTVCSSPISPAAVPMEISSNDSDLDKLLIPIPAVIPDVPVDEIMQALRGPFPSDIGLPLEASQQTRNVHFDIGLPPQVSEATPNVFFDIGVPSLASQPHLNSERDSVSAPAAVDGETCSRCIRLAHNKPPATSGQIYARRADLVVLQNLCKTKRDELSKIQESLFGSLALVQKLVDVYIASTKVLRTAGRSNEEAFQKEIRGLRNATTAAQTRMKEETEDQVLAIIRKAFPSRNDVGQNFSGSEHHCPGKNSGS